MFPDFIICLMVQNHSFLTVSRAQDSAISLRPGENSILNPTRIGISVLIFLNSVGLFTQVCVKKIHVGPLRGLKPTISGSNGCAWADSKSDVTIVSACLNSTNKNVLTRILFYSFENITFFPIYFR